MQENVEARKSLERMLLPHLNSLAVKHVLERQMKSYSCDECFTKPGVRVRHLLPIRDSAVH